MSYYEPYNVEAAILSEALLDQFVMTFDYARDAVWLEPLPDIPQAFNRSGVLATKLPDGAFRVRRILAHSPAIGADVRLGDRIVAVDGKPASQFSGAEFARANDARAATITFRIERGAQHHRVSIGLRNLLPAS
jgi:C-terminal processing protease CtpA/Prc